MGLGAALYSARSGIRPENMDWFPLEPHEPELTGDSMSRKAPQHWVHAAFRQAMHPGPGIGGNR